MFFDFFKFKIPKGAWLGGDSAKKFLKIFSGHKNTRPKTYTAFGRGENILQVFLKTFLQSYFEISVTTIPEK